MKPCLKSYWIVSQKLNPGVIHSMNVQLWWKAYHWRRQRRTRLSYPQPRLLQTCFRPQRIQSTCHQQRQWTHTKKVCIQSKGLQLSFIQNPANANMYCRLKSSRIRHSSHYKAENRIQVFMTRNRVTLRLTSFQASYWPQSAPFITRACGSHYQAWILASFLTSEGY
jgi:hypothetical protein